MQVSIRRSAITLVMLLTATVGIVALPGSAAYADPVDNRVTTTAYIWNCPTGAPGCYPGEQTRVGDVRVGDPLTDACRVTFGSREKNLVYNRTNRGGAADRTGFLYRSNLATPGYQTDSCYSAGLENRADGSDVVQRLCPYDTCGATFDFPSNYSDYRVRELCSTWISGADWHLTVAYHVATGGPLTAGFIRAEDLRDPYLPQQNDCEFPF